MRAASSAFQLPLMITNARKSSLSDVRLEEDARPVLHVSNNPMAARPFYLHLSGEGGKMATILGECPCCQGSLERLTWKALLLETINRESSNPRAPFPVEILETTFWQEMTANPDPWKIDYQTSEKVAISFQTKSPLAMTTSLKIPMIFRDHYFTLKFLMVLQCLQCQNAEISFEGIIKVHDPTTMFEWHVELDMLTPTPVLSVIDSPQVSLQGEPFIGCFVNIRLSVNPNNIPPLRSPIPIQFWIDHSHGRLYSRHFTIYEVNPSSWLPTANDHVITVTACIGLKSSWHHPSVREFLASIMNSQEQSFTLRIEGPLIVAPSRPRLDVQVFINPNELKVLNAITSRSDSLLRPEDARIMIARMMEEYLEARIVMEKLQKRSWDELLPIHELVEVKVYRESRISASNLLEPYHERVPFLELLNYVFSHPFMKTRIIVSGIPGIGKTACAVQLVRSILSVNTDQGMIFPVYLELGREADRQFLDQYVMSELPALTRRQRGIRRLLIEQLGISEEDEKRLVNALFSSDGISMNQDVRLAWFLDGWNESPPSFQNRITKVLFRRLGRHDDVFFIFTRPGSIPNELTKLTDSVLVDIQSLSEDKAMELVQHAIKIKIKELQSTMVHVKTDGASLHGNFPARASRAIVTKLSETVSERGLIPFFLIPLASDITERWFLSDHPSKDLKEIIKPYFKSRMDLLRAIWYSILIRNAQPTFIDEIIMRFFGSHFENTTDIREKIMEFLLERVELIQALATHELYLARSREKGTWFRRSDIEDAIIRTLAKDDWETTSNTITTLSSPLINSHETRQDSHHQIIWSEHGVISCQFSVIPPNGKSSVASGPHHAFLTISKENDDDSQTSITIMINITELSLHALFPRIHRYATLSTTHPPSLSSFKLATRVTTKMADTRQLPDFIEEREVWHELLADYLLARGILATWGKVTANDSQESLPAGAYLQWLGNEQFDETWQMVFTSSIFNNQLQEIMPFFEKCLSRATLTPREVNFHVNTLKHLVSIFVTSELDQFAISGVDWDLEKTFRVRLSPRGISVVQLQLALKPIQPIERRVSMLNQLITDYLQHLKSLHTLDLSLNELPFIPESIGNITSLQVLSLGSNNLRQLPTSIRKLVKLRELYLEYNPLSQWPDVLSELSNLQVLNIAALQLTDLPESIGNLAQLQMLFLDENRLKTLPPFIEKLKNLQELTISQAQLEMLPPEIGNLTSLRALDLSFNDLQNLPETLGQLVNLRELEISCNNLLKLPDSITNLVNLEELYASSNRLTSIPDTIGKMANLRILSLNDNQLRSIPESIGKLSNLQECLLGSNKLMELPESLGQLTNLRILSLEQNDLKQLPASIINLMKLEFLNLQGNRNLQLTQEQHEWIRRLEQQGTQVDID